MTARFRNARFGSARLTMRPQSVADADALFEAYGDVDLMTYWSSAPHTSVAQSRAYLAKCQPPFAWRGWTMRERATGAILGTLSTREVRPGVAEIGYIVLRRYWRGGYGREGVSRLIDLLFLEGSRRITADVDPDNVASNTLLDRLGFTMEGRLRAEWETHIGVRDSHIWGLLREEWSVARAA
ncbi:GNAT family N-acetyltransferase [uncultured Sphingomonas sp.]|uniref:GNAT family N-acetyltransferase n=1 Tax=uncultured Sphingomonas sp. TaxID=158754 RepID=UPI0025D51391|nr:GNAT family N-acetyltransferase [uncultured Sphingomonas sp.]